MDKELVIAITSTAIPFVTILIGMFFNNRRFDLMDGRFDRMDGRLDRMDNRLDRIDNQLLQIGADLRQFYHL